MRSLSREARYERRVPVIRLRVAGRTYDEIAAQIGLSRTRVFDICKRHEALRSACAAGRAWWSQDGRRSSPGLGLRGDAAPPLAAGITKVLKRLHYPLDVLLLCVRWQMTVSAHIGIIVLQAGFNPRPTLYPYLSGNA